MDGQTRAEDASAKLCVQDQGKRGKATSLGIGGNTGKHFALDTVPTRVLPNGNLLSTQSNPSTPQLIKSSITKPQRIPSGARHSKLQSAKQMQAQGVERTQSNARIWEKKKGLAWGIQNECALEKGARHSIDRTIRYPCERGGGELKGRWRCRCDLGAGDWSCRRWGCGN